MNEITYKLDSNSKMMDITGSVNNPALEKYIKSVKTEIEGIAKGNVSSTRRKIGYYIVLITSFLIFGILARLVVIYSQFPMVPIYFFIVVDLIFYIAIFLIGLVIMGKKPKQSKNGCYHNRFGEKLEKYMNKNGQKIKN